MPGCFMPRIARSWDALSRFGQSRSCKLSGMCSENSGLRQAIGELVQCCGEGLRHGLEPRNESLALRLGLGGCPAVRGACYLAAGNKGAITNVAQLGNYKSENISNLARRHAESSRSRCGGGGKRVADGVTVDDQLDAAGTLAALGGVVRNHGLPFSPAAGGE